MAGLAGRRVLDEARVEQVEVRRRRRLVVAPAAVEGQRGAEGRRSAPRQRDPGVLELAGDQRLGAPHVEPADGREEPPLPENAHDVQLDDVLHVLLCGTGLVTPVNEPPIQVFDQLEALSPASSSLRPPIVLIF